MPDPVPTPTPTPIPTPEPSGNPWYHGADAETIGHMQNRGWTTKTANEVALEAIKAHREAEKYIGVPADQIIRLPKDAADEAGWKAVHQRLGAPADPKEYDFSSVKGAGGQPLGEPLVNFLRGLASDLHLSKDAATALANKYAAFEGNTTQATAAERTAVLTQQKERLAQNWGPNADTNLIIARNAARALGVPPEAVTALEGTIGYDKVMEMFRQIGTKIGEDRFVAGAGLTAGGVMTRDQAVAKRGELMSDKDWVKSYVGGDQAKKREMMTLQSIITGVALPV